MSLIKAKHGNHNGRKQLQVTRAKSKRYFNNTVMHIAGELQTFQNEPAAGNFATFSGIFAAYSTFRFNNVR